MNKVKVKESKIHGLGLFADQEFNEGDMIGLAHYNGVPSEIIGKYHNHSDNPNAHSITIGNKRFLVALNPLKKGEEITVDYRQQPDLEQPEEFAKGGLVSMPKPSKKGLASKRYSRDLTATNRLLTKNKLLQKPKSKKRKIYDPNAKYYQTGGESNDRQFRKELMKEYPGMQGVYGRRGQKLRITEDPNYVASQHGNFGNIEFMFPHQDPINYTEDYSYASPHPRKYNLIYNPEGANRGDMFLDMMHGMRDDENYMKLLENFNAAVKQDRGANMDKWWAVDEAEGYSDGREQWDNNYIDGVLRAELNRLDPIAATSFDAEGYAKERELNTDPIRNAAQDIYTYLKTKHKDGGQLGNYKKGGEPKGDEPKGDEPKRKKTRFQEGTYDPNETAGYMLDEQEVVVPGQASPWGKARIAYQERHPEEEFVERKKKQYVRQSNKGLNKIFGVSTENFNPDVEQNFRDEYDYNTNTAVVKKVGKQEGWNPNKRKEYVDDLNETQRQIVANSKYGSKLQPNFWDRGLAGLATLVSPFNPGIQRMMNEGYMPGLTKRESKEILNSKMFGIPVGGLEITTPLLAQGQALANYAKNTGLSTGSDYKEIPWFGSGESMANVSDKDVMGLDLPSLVGLGFAPEGAVNFAKGAYNLGSAGVDLAKTNPQAWFKTPEQLLQTPELYQSLAGKTSWKDPLGKLYKFTDDVKMKKSLKRENDLLDTLPGWENRQTRIPLQQEEQMKRLQLEKAAEARNLKRSKLPLKPVLTQHGTHLGGGQGRIYLNTLNPEEVVKLGTLPGTPEDLSNLVKAGENLEGMPFMENVAFPTNKSFSIFHEPVNNNTTAVQFMPWQGNPLDVNNPVNIPFGSGMPSAKAKRQLQYMTEQLDKNKVGIDYYGQNNIMYDPSTDSFKLVDLNYVDDPKTAWEWNKANIPVKQRIEDKFGYIPEGDLPLELEFANAKSIKPLLGNEITDNTGKFNKGVYTFKDYPQFVAKAEDPNIVAKMQGLDTDVYLNSMVERTKNLDPTRFAKVLKTVPGKGDVRMVIMPRLRGDVGSKLNPEILNSIPDESYADFYNQLKLLRDEGLNYDFFGDNFMYDPYTEQFNLFDLSPQSFRTAEPGYGNPQFFETQVFGGGNPGIYGREQAGANLKDALRKRLNRTYMEAFPGDQEVYGLDEYDQRLKAIFENLSSQKYGGANSKLFRFN